MADIALDQAIPIVRDLATRKSSAFVRRYRFAIDESEDIASHLVLTFIARWPRFDAERASVQTFASRLMDKELMSLLRYRLAQSRQRCEVPVQATGPTFAAIHQFRVDVERAMASLPEAIRVTASALSWHSSVDTARATGCSRQMIARRKHMIRDALLAGGITASYFAAGGARS